MLGTRTALSDLLDTPGSHELLNRGGRVVVLLRLLAGDGDSDGLGWLDLHHTNFPSDDGVIVVGGVAVVDVDDLARRVRLWELQGREGEAEPEVAGPVVSLALLSAVASLALAASSQARLATVSNTADVALHLDLVRVGSSLLYT